MSDDPCSKRAVLGCLLGGAVGDALGLPYEGLSPRRAARLLGPPDRMRFCFRRGMFSDDTEHACMTAQALIETRAEPDRFHHDLARRLRHWLLRLPAGTGMATARAILRLWVGYRAESSGVFSAGNGPAMRSGILGAATRDNEALHQLVRLSTRITHTDPKAEHGAMAVALATRIAATTSLEKGFDADALIAALRARFHEEGAEFVELIERAATSAAGGESTAAYAETLGLAGGVSGYVYHCVPVSLHACFAHPHDYRAAITAVIECGGDADTTAAMTGGIVGAAVGPEGLPQDWIGAIRDWPCSVSWIEQLGESLGEACRGDFSKSSPKLPWAAVIVRNLFFLGLVLYHGFRRLAPPY